MHAFYNDNYVVDNFLGGSVDIKKVFAKNSRHVYGNNDTIYVHFHRWAILKSFASLISNGYSTVGRSVQHRQPAYVH